MMIIIAVVIEIIVIMMTVMIKMLKLIMLMMIDVDNNSVDNDNGYDSIHNANNDSDGHDENRKK